MGNIKNIKIPLYLEIINTPKIIKLKPISFDQVNTSSNINKLNINTNTKDKLIKGYAKDNSNLVSTAPQQKLAKKAAAKPDIIQKSMKALIINQILSKKNSVSGICPFKLIRHLITN